MGSTTMQQAPARTVEQRNEALVRANDVRHRRAELKRDLKAGRVRLAGLLTEPPEWLLSARVFDLMLTLPGVGSSTVLRAFRVAQASHSKTVGGLSVRQRDRLLRELGERAR